MILYIYAYLNCSGNPNTPQKPNLTRNKVKHKHDILSLASYLISVKEFTMLV